MSIKPLIGSNLYELLDIFFREFCNVQDMYERNIYSFRVSHDAMKSWLIPELAERIDRLLEERPGTWRSTSRPTAEQMRKLIEDQLTTSKNTIEREGV